MHKETLMSLDLMRRDGFLGRCCVYKVLRVSASRSDSIGVPPKLWGSSKLELLLLQVTGTVIISIDPFFLDVP